MHGQFRLFGAVLGTYSQDYPQKMGTEIFHANRACETLFLRNIFERHYVQFRWRSGSDVKNKFIMEFPVLCL